MQAEDTVSERLRRWTRNPLGSARRDSNPLGVDCRGGEKWHANNPLLGVQHVSTGGVKAAKQVGLSSLADGQKCSGSA